jgi:hypothetical protein
MRPVKKQAVINFFGSASKAAEALDITRQAVGEWGEILPELMAYKVQVVTKGKLQVDIDVYRRIRERKKRIAAGG